MKIRRDDLYKAVWSKPIGTLAQEWGISDVGLAKACRKTGIPLPGLGYWAKVAVGRVAAPPPLKGDHDIEVSFQGDPSLRKVELHPDGKALVARAADGIDQWLAEAKEDPPRLGKWTARTAKALSRKPDQSGLLTATGKAFHVRISEGTRDRAISILNVVELALEKAGMRWAISEQEHAVVGTLYGETVSFSLEERYSRTEHIERDPKYSWADKKTYTCEFTGDLVLKIHGWYDGRKSWADGKTQRLIQKLPEVIEGFIAAADGLRRKRLEIEERNRRWAEEARLRAERERVEREEKAFLDATIKEANDWAQANVIRNYAAHLRKRIADETIVLTPEGENWLTRVEAAADRLDSAMKRLDV